MRIKSHFIASYCAGVLVSAILQTSLAEAPSAATASIDMKQVHCDTKTTNQNGAKQYKMHCSLTQYVDPDQFRAYIENQSVVLCRGEKGHRVVGYNEETWQSGCSEGWGRTIDATIWCFE